MRRSDDDPDQTRVPLGPDPSVRRLSPREREIAILLARGLTDAAIGRSLGISGGSVGNAVRRIRLRLRLDSRAEIAAWVTARLDPDDPSGNSLRRPPVDG
jgi:DNA-binding CsgD family transcriptional regulator